MKNYCKKCRQLTLYFLVLFSCIVVGYALVTQILTITGTSSVTGTWDVKITGVGTPTFTLGANNASTPSFTDTTATFSVNLPAPGASAVYPVTVKNNGNISAKLTAIDGITAANSAAPTDVNYTCNAAVNDVLAPGVSTTYNVTVTWDSNATSIPTPTTKSATITLTYSQNT